MDQKEPKIGVAKFFPDCKPKLSKEDHEKSFYTGNQQNSMIRLENFGSERVKFRPKMAQNAKGV